ncbi:MAG: hypothetical protein H6656_09050 [Ardenticatenaceae bacterium]|nr:hypothetical protein [Ardenticatenaceae bacterium]
MNKTKRILDAVMQLNSEITEIALITVFFAIGLIINMPALQTILMMGVTFVITFIVVSGIFLILVLDQEPDVTHS